MLQNFLSLFLQVAVFSSVLTYGLTKLARKLKWLDKDPHGIQEGTYAPVATHGGLAIFLSFWLGAFLFIPQLAFIATYRWLFVASLMILILGIVDDRLELSPLVKSLFIFLAANIVYFYAGIEFSSRLLPEGMPHIFSMLPYLATMAWIYFVTNAINIIDGTDGLAGSVSLISLSTLALTTYLFSRSLQITLLTLLLILVAAILGFLPFNWPPAKIYLGDTGALFIGFMYATLSVNSLKNASLYSLIVPVIIYMFPLFDITYAMFRRLIKRQPIGKGDREHLHHRLLGFGFSKKQVVWSVIAVTSLFSVIAICSHVWPSLRWFWLGLTGSIIFLLMWVMRRLAKISQMNRQAKQKNKQ